MNNNNKKTANKKLRWGIVIRNTTDAGWLKQIGLPTDTIFELDKVGCATLFEAPASEPAQSKTPKVREFNVTIVTGGVLSALPNWKKTREK